MMRTLFTLALFELFIGGGGRLTAVGPVSLRMILFAVILGVSVLAILFPRRRADGVLLAMLLVIIYLLVHVGGLVVGSINSGRLSQMFTEFQQSLYWLAAPFFALMIQSEQDVSRCATIVKIAGAFLACAYLGILLGLLTGILPLGLLKAIISASGEVVFRSGEFFIYKGFLYLGISIVFFVAMRSRHWALLATLVAIALAFTFTRGYLISTAGAVLLMLCVQGRWRTAIPAICLIAAAAFLLWFYLPSLDQKVLEAHESSTNARIDDMYYIMHHATAGTLLFGEGFGSLINDRYQIENTFLMVLWKLGVPGLLFWLSPLALCVYHYAKIPNRRWSPLANAYLFGTVLVYLQTATNPYLNNPIGLSYVILSIFSLRALHRQAIKKVTAGEFAGATAIRPTGMING
jgi:hypothetical protein